MTIIFSFEFIFLKIKKKKKKMENLYRWKINSFQLFDIVKIFFIISNLKWHYIILFMNYYLLLFGQNRNSVPSRSKFKNVYHKLSTSSVYVSNLFSINLQELCGGWISRHSVSMSKSNYEYGTEDTRQERKVLTVRMPI